MFRSKKEVDKHVADILNKIKNENERSLRGFVIAKLYYMVGDYETAKRYLAGFISVKERDANAHKLMGKIYERTCHLEKAVQSYKKSLELLDNQTDVVLKICELYCQLSVDPERARYWADRAEKLFPNNEIVFKLRECIVNADGEQNTHELEQLIATELMNRPRDANLRIKLLKLYLDTERSKEAYHHAIDVERKHPYHDNINWYYCIIDVLEAYLEDNGKEYKTELLKQLLHSYDRLVFLSLEENHQSCRISNRILHPTNLMNSASGLHSFDQTLYKAEQHEESDESWKCFLNHMKGQLYFHFGTFLLKRAKKDHGQGNVKEASRMSAALFLLAYAFKPFDRHSSWYCQASEDKKKEFDYIYNQACFRLSQTGHVIIGICKEDKSKWLQKIRLQVFTTQCKDKIFQRIFNTQETRQTSNTSYFSTSQTFLDFSPEFPDINTVQEYDEVTYSMYPESLHHIVWLALQYYSLKQKVQPDYKITIFDGLQYSVNNINTATAETLCLLDVEAFLYATVQTVALALEERHSSSYSSSDFPSFLPVAISPALCTADQAEWWSTAYKLFKNTAKENLGKLRGILQHGIEVIRVIGNHGMHVSLVVHLAETFAERAIKLKNQNEENLWHLLERRAAHYWKAAINMLEKLANNQSLRLPKQCLFETNSQDPSMKELKKLLEAGRFFLACQAMNANKFEEALEGFESLKSPYASYYQATIFKKLAAEEYNQPKEQITSEMRSKHIILLTRARDALYATLDRIHGDRKHPLNQVLSEEIEDIETKLRRIDPDVSQRHDFDCLSDECLSSQDSEDRNHSPDSAPQTYLTRQTFRKSSGFSHSRNLLHSTPHIPVPYFSSGRDSAELQASYNHREEHTRPSPERLDAQMRSLAFSHDAVIKTIVEQNKPLLETHHSIVEVLQQIKTAIDQIKTQLVEIQKQINNQAPRRRPQKKLLTSNKHVIPQQKLWNGNKMDEQEHNEEDYEGYYYDDQTEYEDPEEAENNYQDFQFHPAFKYPEPLHNEYPYGQITGLHGTSTVTYAPPQANSRNLVGHHAVPSAPPPGTPAYPAYYPPQMINPVAHSHQTPALRHPLPTQALGPGYFGPSAPTLSTGLTFSEGQKLPEFHFNPTIPPPNGSFSAVYTEHKTPVFSRLGPPPVPPNESSATNETKFAAIPGYNPSVIPDSDTVIWKPVPPAVDANEPVLPSAGGTSVECLTLSNPITIYSVPTSAPHAFQIPLPPQAKTSTSGTTMGTSTSLATGDFTVPPVVIAPTQSAQFVPQVSPLQLSRCADKRPNETSVQHLNSEEDHYREDEEYSGPDFKPVIPLPDEVDVKTGEEDEKILFECKAKLFRFVDKEWKERGVGFVKLLWHEKTGKVRVLMRRDQIFKICANHYIQTDMKLAPMKNNDSAWVWAAQDFADEQVKTEQFCIKFKTPEIANTFKREFEKAQHLIENAEKSVAKSSHPTENVQLKNHTSVSDSSQGFGCKFLPEPGSWKCSSCWIINTADSTQCAACQTAKSKSSSPAKPDQSVEAVHTKPVKIPEKGFGSEFLPKPGSWTCSTCLVINPASSKICVACESPNPSVPTPTSMLNSENFSNAPKFSFSLPQTPTSMIFGFKPPSNDSAVDVKSSLNEPSVFKTNTADTSQHSIVNIGDFSFSLPKTPIEQNNSILTSESGKVDNLKKNHTEKSSFSFLPTATTTSTDTPSSSCVSSNPNSNTALKSSGFVFGNISSNTTPKSTGFVFGISSIQDDGKSVTEKNMGSASSLLNAMAAKHQTDDKTSQTTSSYTFTYGGFTFTTSPTIKTSDDSEANKTPKPLTSKFKERTSENPAVDSGIKTSPFAGFSFTSNKTDLANSTPSEKLERSTEPAITLAAIFANKPTDEIPISFSALASSSHEADGFKTDPNFQGFSGSGESVFKKLDKSTSSPTTQADEYEPPIEFKPVIPLPDLVEIKTGEEDEEKLFGERAKLYRFDSMLNQWKERGVGEIKLLRHKISGKCRVLMRREQVLKICANHYIQPDTKLKELATTTNGWTWLANDYSEGELKLETLAIKFKTPEQANAFKTIFMKCAGDSGNSLAHVETDAVKNSNKPTFQFSKKDVPLSELFKPEIGSWTCPVCCVRNKSEVVQCVACTASNPNIKPSEISKSSSNSEDKSKLNQSDSVFWLCKSCNLKNSDETVKCSCGSLKTDSELVKKPQFPFSVSSDFKFQFGSDSGSQGFNFSSPSLSKSGGFVFGMSSAESKTNIGDSNKIDMQSSEAGKSTVENTDEETSVSATEFRFGSPQKFTFSFSGIRPKSPVKTPKSPHSEVSKDKSISGDDDDSLTESEGDHIYFQPVIPLPDKIDVKTGEEDEEALYCQRAKLFRLIDSEWKERGIGDIKILQHYETQKIRLLMRRDQILKVCLNHSLTPEMKFLSKDDKSWIWVTTDFADNEPRQERFAIRFKNSEISKQFIQAINDAKNRLKNLGKENKSITKESEKKELEEQIGSTVSEANVIPVESTSQSSLSSFSFKMENVCNTSPSVNFSFGNKFGTTSPPGKFSLFGGGTKSSSLSQSDLFVFGSGNLPQTNEDDEVKIIYVKEATQEQKDKAQALLLPSNFFLYEEAPPCSGCRGCIDSFGQETVAASNKINTDVEIITEEVADAEKIALALKLQLPRNFYLYENKPPCPGCRGCSDEIPLTVEEKGTSQNFTKEKEDTTSELFQSSGIDFASLAKEGTTFLTKASSDFTFNNFGNKVFGSDEVEPESTDTKEPHFEPIVPLPELIEVKTGEEDELKVYGQRAKLYRFDASKKEWKERGVGEMKILKHKETGRIRLLLRREQVHKIACNHYVTQDMKLTPLATSETAWCWHAMDFSEGTSKLEQFAIKFKTVQTAQEFKSTFERYQLEASEKQTEKKSDMAFGDSGDSKDSVTPKAECRLTDSTVKDLAVENTDIKKEDLTLVSQDNSQQLSCEQKCTNSNEDDDDEEEDDDEESVMFEKRVSLAYYTDNKYENLGIGNLRVLYDDDVYGARIQVITDDGFLICNHIIAMQTTLKVDDNICYWSSQDFSTDIPVQRQFRATFSSSASAKEFQVIFAEGKECAKHSEIWEKPYNPSFTDDLSDHGGDKHTATLNHASSSQASKEAAPPFTDVKACSPELAQALRDIMSGIH